LTETEWLDCHPEQATQYLSAWETKESREDYRNALLRFTMAQLVGGKKKNGRQLKLDDFLPAYCRRKRKPTKTLDEQAPEIEKMFAEFIIKKPNG
jgi:hypothetical protein